eukprot:1348394-Amorphochlora_amoeboformis.AAC.1
MATYTRLGEKGSPPAVSIEELKARFSSRDSMQVPPPAKSPPPFPKILLEARKRVYFLLKISVHFVEKHNLGTKSVGSGYVKRRTVLGSSMYTPSSIKSLPLPPRQKSQTFFSEEALNPSFRLLTQMAQLPSPEDPFRKDRGFSESSGVNRPPMPTRRN